MNTHTIPIVPRHSEVDINGQVKLRAVFDYLQEAAAQHAELKRSVCPIANSRRTPIKAMQA